MTSQIIRLRDFPRLGSNDFLCRRGGQTDIPATATRRPWFYGPGGRGRRSGGRVPLRKGSGPFLDKSLNGLRYAIRRSMAPRPRLYDHIPERPSRAAPPDGLCEWTVASRQDDYLPRPEVDPVRKLEQENRHDAANSRREIASAYWRTPVERSDVVRSGARDRAQQTRGRSCPCSSWPAGKARCRAIAFYGRDGQERSRYRLVGCLDGPQFAAAVHAAFGSQRCC